MPARFFVDENDLALGKALAAAHDGILCHWARMNALVDEETPGPWMYSVTRERLQPIDL